MARPSANTAQHRDSAGGTAHSMDWHDRVRRTAFWPLVPILLWNVALWPYLPAVFANDGPVPRWVLTVEGLGRAFVFVVPLGLTLSTDETWARRGRLLFWVGALAYAASWLAPLLELERWTWLGPYALPAVWLAGLGLWARSPGYIVGAMVFIAAHVTHGALVLWSS